MLKKVILCPNPYRDHELTVAKEAKRILDSVHCPNVVCVPFRNEEKPRATASISVRSSRSCAART